MLGHSLTLFVRGCLGIAMILNGPAHVCALALLPTAENSKSSGDAQPTAKKCCNRSSGQTPASTSVKVTICKSDGDKIRPTCPRCPACPDHLKSCCVNCPSKAPGAPLVLFVIPDSSPLVWQLAEDDLSLSSNLTDKLVLPPRYSQFVAVTI